MRPHDSTVQRENSIGITWYLWPTGNVLLILTVIVNVYCNCRFLRSNISNLKENMSYSPAQCLNLLDFWCSFHLSTFWRQLVIEFWSIVCLYFIFKIMLWRICWNVPCWATLHRFFTLDFRWLKPIISMHTSVPFNFLSSVNLKNRYVNL